MVIKFSCQKIKIWLNHLSEQMLEKRLIVIFLYDQDSRTKQGVKGYVIKDLFYNQERIQISSYTTKTQCEDLFLVFKIYFDETNLTYLHNEKTNLYQFHLQLKKQVKKK